MELALFQLMAHWGLQVIMLYVAEAPLATVSSKLRQLLTQRPLQERRADMIQAEAKETQRASDHTAELDALRAKQATLNEQIVNLTVELKVLRELASNDMDEVKIQLESLSLGAARFVRRVSRHYHHQFEFR